MPDFSEFADDAKKVAGEHDQQSDQAFDKAAQFADDKTGNKYDSQITSGEDKAEGYLGVQDQDQQGQGQDQNQDQNQNQN
jgi:MT0933-like antitoxin protein